MRRAIVIYAGLLLVALGAAYHTWTHEDELALSDAVVIVPGEPNALESVAYKSKELELTITLREDERGRYAWVRAVPLEIEVDPDAPPNPHALPPDTETEEFKAGKGGETVLEGLAPFVAKRLLEGIDDSKLGDLGLDEPDASLTITRRDKGSKTFDLGTDAYGGANIYARDPETGKIYLLDAKLIRPLQSGKRTLPDRDLVGVQIKDIERIQIDAADASASFEQHNPDDPQATFWSAVGENEANATAAAWIDKALRLRSSKYVDEAAAPVGLEQVFSFTVVAGDVPPTTVQVHRSLGEGGEETWYARSEHTRGLVELHKTQAAEALADLQSVLGEGEPG
jgi:hypothetical protein